MLANAHRQGVHAALAHLGIKEAWSLRDIAQGLKTNLIGRPGQLFVEGPRAFSNKGSLSMKNVFWPAVSGPGGSKLNWINRASTLSSANQVRHAITDPSDEPRAPHVLGALGGLAGQAYGFNSLGVLGAPLAGRAGAALGHGIGNLLGG